MLRQIEKMKIISNIANNLGNRLRVKLQLMFEIIVAAAFGLSVFSASAAEFASQAAEDAGVGVGFDSGFDVDSLIQVLIALISVICIIFVLSILLKKFNILPSASSGLIKIVAGISLSSKDRLLLIQVGEEQILVSASPGSINKIHKLSAIVEPEVMSSEQSSKSANFSSLLNSVVSRSRS